MSDTDSSSDLAPDFESLPMWCLNEATTSFAVTSLPLWNVRPLRSLKTHFLVSLVGSMVSARSPTILLFASTSVRLFDMAPQNGTWVPVSR